MRLFGFEFARSKGPLVSTRVESREAVASGYPEAIRSKALSPITDWRGGWRTIMEPFTGAWQRNKEETRETILCYPTLYACLDSISSDVGKLPFTIRRQNEN